MHRCAHDHAWSRAMKTSAPNIVGRWITWKQERRRITSPIIWGSTSNSAASPGRDPPGRASLCAWASTAHYRVYVGLLGQGTLA